MTVRELTNFLSQIPEEYQDMMVVDSEYDRFDGNWKILEDYPLGDSANPMCEFVKAIYIE